MNVNTINKQQGFSADSDQPPATEATLAEAIHLLRNSLTPSIISQSMIREYFAALPIDHIKKALEELSDNTISDERKAQLNTFLNASVDQIGQIQEQINHHLDRIEQSASNTERLLTDFENNSY